MRPKYFYAIVIVLFLTVVNEVVVVPYVKANKLFNRNIAYNVFSIIDMTGWFYVFFKIHALDKKRRSWISWGAFLCFVYSGIELSMSGGWKNLHPNSFRIYNVVIILSCMSYFNLMMKREYHNFLNDQVFWVCSACFLFHLIFFINITTLAENSYWKVKDADQIFNILNNVANSCYYLLLCTAFLICSYKRRLNHQAFHQISS